MYSNVFVNYDLPVQSSSSWDDMRWTPDAPSIPATVRPTSLWLYLIGYRSIYFLPLYYWLYLYLSRHASMKVYFVLNDLIANKCSRVLSYWFLWSSDVSSKRERINCRITLYRFLKFARNIIAQSIYQNISGESVNSFFIV